MISNETIKDVVEYVTQGNCVLEVITTPVHVIKVVHVHCTLFERMTDERERIEFLERAFAQELQRRGIRDDLEYLGFKAYPSIEYKYNNQLQQVFKQHASKAN